MAGKSATNHILSIDTHGANSEPAKQRTDACKVVAAFVKAMAKLAQKRSNHCYLSAEMDSLRTYSDLMQKVLQPKK